LNNYENKSVEGRKRKPNQHREFFVFQNRNRIQANEQYDRNSRNQIGFEETTVFCNRNQKRIKHNQSQTNHGILKNMDFDFADVLNQKENQKCEPDNQKSVF